MFYLANDVIQNSKKKGCRQYLDGFKDVLKQSTQIVKDERIAPKIDRIFSIWADRNVYSEDFINELKQILNGTPITTKPTSKKSESNYASNNRVPTDFSLINLEKKAKEIESIDKSSSLLIGNLNLKKIDLINSDILSHLKDKKAGEQCCRELNEIEVSLKAVVSALQKQVDYRSALLDTLEKCELFYETQNSEVKIVENAYKNFNLRVKGVKNKLTSSQAQFLSPFIDAPSPNSDDDLLLPDNHPSGIKNLLNALSESSTKSNKISSLDNRLSNLMQSLPAINTLGNTSTRDVNQHESSWSANQAQKAPFSLEPHSNLTHQMQHQFNPLLSQQPPPKINQSHIPPINVHHPPPFIPSQMHQPPPLIKKQHDSHLDPNYYFPPGYPGSPHLASTVKQQPLNETASSSFEYYDNSNKFSHHPNTNNLYNNSRNTSIQQIKSVISTRNEQQLESNPNDSSLPYDPYDSVGASNSLENFEPTDMDIGNSDDEEMNRSSNSQRFLKVIETSNGNSSFSSNNVSKKPVPAFSNYNNQQYKQPSNHHQTSIHPQNLHPINPIPSPVHNPINNVPVSLNLNSTTSHLNDFKAETSKLPPQLPPHITSSSLTLPNPTSQLPSVPSYHQPSNFYNNNNKQSQNFNNKFNSPAKGYVASDTRLPTGKPRWPNSNHQLTGSPMNHKQHQLTNNNNLNNFKSMSNNQSMSTLNNSNTTQYGSNRHQNNNNNRPWKRNNNNNNKNYNQHHQSTRNRSFSNSSNLNYNSNNNVNLSNLSSVVSNDLSHQNQYQ